MKQSPDKYLFAWCGVTDLLSALGEEKQDGPILSAALHGDYSHIYVLCYRKRDSILTRENASPQLLERLERCKKLNSTERKQLSQEIINSHLSFDIFEQWLSEKLHAVGKSPIIIVRSKGLFHLNDTEGIYEHVQKSFNHIERESGAATVTIHLSPGTPVMAFVSAFASLTSHKLNIGFISTSQASFEPETINLPQQWVTRHGSHFNQDSHQLHHDFDVIIHLFGKERMPILQCIRQFKAQKHTFLHDREYDPTVMKEFLEESAFDRLEVSSSFDFDIIIKRLRRYINDESHVPTGARIAINLTGGTKIMFAAAYEICREMNCTPLYVDGKKKSLLFIRDSLSVPINPIYDVTTYLKLHQPHLRISNEGLNTLDDLPNAELRAELAAHLWSVSQNYSWLYSTDSFKAARKAYEKHNKKYKKTNPQDDIPRVLEGQVGKEKWLKFKAELHSDGSASISITKSSNNATIVNYHFDVFPDFYRFFLGCWLEEHSFNQLQSLQDEGIIHDLRMGVTVALNNAPSQEFDILFTDGHMLYVVECKSGKISGEDAPKLFGISQKFGGLLAQPVLITSNLLYDNEEDKVVLDKIINSKTMWIQAPRYTKDWKRDRQYISNEKLFLKLLKQIRLKSHP